MFRFSGMSRYYIGCYFRSMEEEMKRRRMMIED